MLIITLIFLLIYLIAMMAIGIYGRKRSSSLTGFTLAGSSMGGMLIGLSVFASWMSASTFMGVPAFFYNSGWPAYSLAISVVFIAPMALALTVRKLREKARLYDAKTVTDLISLMYNSYFIKIIVSILSINLFITLMISQLKAVGLIFQTSVGIEYWQAVLLGTIITTFYIFFGGMWASIVTDGIQAIIMLATALILVPVGLWAVGGFGGFYSALSSISEDFVSFTEPEFFTWPMSISQPFYWGLAIFAMPYVINRLIALKSIKESKKFLLIFWVSNAIGIGFMIVGGIARVLLPNLAEADLSAIALAVEVLPEVFASLVLLGIFLASMSSIDGILHSAGSLIGNDIYLGLIIPTFGKNKNDKRHQKIAVIISQIFVIVFAVIPVYFAVFNPPELLALFMYWGLGLMGSGTVAPLLFGVFWKRSTRLGASLASLIGPVSFLLFDILLGIETYINLPLSTIVSSCVLVGVSLAKNKNSKELLLQESLDN